MPGFNLLADLVIQDYFEYVDKFNKNNNFMDANIPEFDVDDENEEIEGFKDSVKLHQYVSISCNFFSTFKFFFSYCLLFY